MRSVNNSQIRSACTKHFMLSHCACVVYSIAAPMTVRVKLKCLSGPIIYFFRTFSNTQHRWHCEKRQRQWAERQQQPQTDVDVAQETNREHANKNYRIVRAELYLSYSPKKKAVWSSALNSRAENWLRSYSSHRFVYLIKLMLINTQNIKSTFEKKSWQLKAFLSCCFCWQLQLLFLVIGSNKIWTLSRDSIRLFPSLPTIFQTSQ